MTQTFEGIVTQVTEIEEGISNSGNAWKKRVFRVEENGSEYPDTAYFTLFGKKVDEIDLDKMIGKVVEVGYNLKARSFITQAGREIFSTDVSAWSVKVK